MNGPRILAIDIETSPLLSYTWGLWDQNVALNQIKEDWSVLSYAAKWVGDSKVFYEDSSKQKNLRDDSKLLKGIWELLDEADIVLSQNGKKFDVKKLNSRFIMHGMQPPSSFKQIDTLQLAKKNFAMTSNKLEYLTEKLCTKYKKLKHSKFPGFELWSECLKGNSSAWAEMKKYNIHDILSLEELYTKLAPWGTGINFAHYTDTDEHVCSCGSTSFRNKGYAYTQVSKFRRLKCTKCGSEVRGRENLFDSEKRKSLKVSTVR